MTEPTRVDLFNLIRSFGYTTSGQTDEIVSAIFENLWTPEQIAEAKERAKKFEPWLRANQEPLGAEFEAVLDKHRSELYAEATQAQAGAVPLTDEPDCGGESCDCRSYCKKKGGQHGADT